MMKELEQLLEEQDRQTSQTLTQLSDWFSDKDILVEETRLIKTELDQKRELIVQQVW